jgi:hypothetical protein
MKVQCDLCREIVVAELTIDGDKIAVRCPSCRGRFLVDATVEAPPEKAVVIAAPIDGPTMTCPKCGTVQRPSDACRQCGLRADKMKSFSTVDDNAPPALTTAWANCLAAWSDPDAHEELAKVAAAYGAYAWVARRYRDRLRDQPSNATAAQRLAAITRITEASLRAGAAVRPDARGAAGHKPYKNVVTILVALVLLAAAGTIYAMVTTPSEDSAAPAPIPIQPVHHR